MCRKQWPLQEMKGQLFPNAPATSRPPIRAENQFNEQVCCQIIISHEETMARSRTDGRTTGSIDNVEYDDVETAHVR